MFSSRRGQEESPLIEAICELRDETRLLRDVLDELSEATTWQNNNAEDYPELVRDRSTVWTLANAKLPKILEALVPVPDTPMLPHAETPARSQKDLF